MTKHTKLGVEEEFFAKLREGSRVKQRIVTEYFVAYNRVMARGSRVKVGFADLFAGPGFYEGGDGSVQKSIPLLVCESAIREELFRQRVHLWFNDGDPKNFKSLKGAINAVPGVATLRYEPHITNRVIDARWASKLGKLGVPTLVFLDPCGYKGLSLKLIASVLNGFGNDCIFFFNYSRINMKLDLAVMNSSMNDFFEAERATKLRAQIQNRSADEREEIILSAVKSAITEVGARALVFRFKSDRGRRSHHLVYASKAQKATEMMMSILRSASSEIKEGVGCGEHDPRARDTTLSLFGGLYAVEERLLSVFDGRAVRFGALLLEEADAQQTQYTESNYRDAVLKLEQDGRVAVDPPSEKRRFQAGGEKRTLPKGVLIRFGPEAHHGN